MEKGLNIAVVGATGAVGREFIQIVEQRRFPAARIRLFSSSRSAGTYLQVNGENIRVEETSPGCFDGIDLSFNSVDTNLTKALTPMAVEAGALVIDDSSAFRMDLNVPLVVPEINGRDVEWHKGIISIPNCATTPVVMALSPLHQVNPILRVVVVTFQSASGAGTGVATDLKEQTEAILAGREVPTGSQPQQMAFNLFPHIGSFLGTGYTEEEQKISEETKKILHNPDIAVSATCVRCPIYVGHSAAVNIEFQNPISPEVVRELLEATAGVKVLDDTQKHLYPTPLIAAGTDDVYVGRIRKDESHANGLVMWTVADNLRKGAALNAIQIAEEVLRRDCLKPGK